MLRSKLRLRLSRKTAAILWRVRQTLPGSSNRFEKAPRVQLSKMLMRNSLRRTPAVRA